MDLIYEDAKPEGTCELVVLQWFVTVCSDMVINGSGTREIIPQLAEIKSTHISRGFLFVLEVGEMQSEMLENVIKLS
jgi:hypothetical protein